MQSMMKYSKGRDTNAPIYWKSELIMVAHSRSSQNIFAVPKLLWGSMSTEFGGGVKSQTSAVGFLKRLVDVVNFEHWKSGYSLADYLSDSGFSDICSESLQRISTIKSVSFYNSICVVDFAGISSEGVIGKRICRGRQALAGYIPVNGQGIKDIGGNQSSNPFNIRQSPSL